VITLEELERCLSVDQVVKLCKVTKATVSNWIKQGIAVNGTRVKLAAVRIGGRWVIPPDAIPAFVTACNPNPPTVIPESPAAQRKRLNDAKERVLRMLRGDDRK